MLPPQLETGLVAGPHSVGSSAGRLAKRNRIFIQSVTVTSKRMAACYAQINHTNHNETALVMIVHSQYQMNAAPQKCACGHHELKLVNSFF
jgi:hypothetical protein